MTDILVSVCIPTYNGQAFIGETLRSALRSSYGCIEVIVSDDASTDRTLSDPALADPRIRVIQGSDRLGPVGNWNRALRAARGELLCLLNHDDLLGPFWIDVAARGLSHFPAAGWAVSAFKTIDAVGHTMSVETRFPASGVYSGTHPFLVIALLGGLGPGFVARRQVLDELGYFNESAGFGADNDLFLRLITRYPLFFSAAPHNSWRSHDTNLTHSWPPSEQAVQGAHMLLALAKDPTCPDWVRVVHSDAVHNLSRKFQRRAVQLAATGDATAARSLLEVSLTLLDLSRTSS